MALPPPICWTQISGLGPPTVERYASSFPSGEIAGLIDTPFEVRRVNGRTAVFAGLECHQNQAASMLKVTSPALKPRPIQVQLRVCATDGAGVNLPESDSSFSSSSATFGSAM